MLGGGADPRAAARWWPALGIVVPSLRRDRDKLVTAMQVTARSIGRALEPCGNQGSDDHA